MQFSFNGKMANSKVAPSLLVCILLYSCSRASEAEKIEKFKCPRPGDGRHQIFCCKRPPSQFVECCSIADFMWSSSRDKYLVECDSSLTRTAEPTTKQETTNTLDGVTFLAQDIQPEENQTGPSEVVVIMSIFWGIVAFIIVVITTCLCCPCCLLSKCIRKREGIVYYQATPVATIVPPAQAFVPQPPLAAVHPQQPVHHGYPPYPDNYGFRTNPTAPPFVL